MAAAAEEAFEERHAHSYDPTSGCAICRNERPFDMPERLLRAALDRQLVIFAGAGVSTESSLVLPWTFYDDAAASVDIDPREGVPFATVMTKYQEAHGRAELLHELKKRLDYIDAFPDLKQMATRFHDELSTLFLVRDILTTNWDSYFETRCGAIPIVTEADYAFWNFPGRKVFKVHGSIQNVGSIVATVDDFATCYENLREGVIGSSLKHLLATKTIVFAGYSFRDDDFNRIYGLVRDQLGPMRPRPVVVTLDEESAAERAEGADVIVTDATFFLRRLKESLVEATECLMPDSRFADIARVLLEVRELHLEMYRVMSVKDEPLILYAGAYQDGLLHSFERILARLHTGEYSHTHDVEQYIRTYQDLQADFRRNRSYADVAYVEGYINGMLYLLADDEARAGLSLYYVPGRKDSIRDLDTFKTAAEQGERLHKAAFRAARAVADEHPDGVVLHHRATLLPPPRPSRRGRSRAK